MCIIGTSLLGLTVFKDISDVRGENCIILLNMLCRQMQIFINVTALGTDINHCAFSLLHHNGR